MPSTPSRRQFLAAAAGSATALLAGCIGGELTEQAEIDRTIQVEDATALAVSIAAGELAVRGADREDVRITGTKHAATESDLEDLTLAERREDDRLVLEREEDGGILPVGSPTGRFDVTVEVPGDLRVASAESTTGTVDVADVTGPTEASATTGRVTVDDVDGAVTADATTGDVDVDGTVGAVEVTTGTVAAAVRDLADPAEIGATTGDVDVRVASDLDVAVTLETSTGSISVGDAFAYESGDDGGVATLGSGDRSLSVETNTGDVTLTTI